ncbi:MAG: gfo/Idh/MocA family oxidoreductase [Phycisphaera sp.]|nr:gfo/Idh/MocA family oxidoreductase [Phycisphaera sp.]
MADPLRWGVLGTGNIARKFATQIQHTAHSRFTAVGSRTDVSAGRFANEFGGADRVHAHGSYDAMLADPDVDAVYISLPNGMHHEWTIRALEAGKHVLCEKPLASNAEQAAEMFDVAERTGKLLVEAFMYRCHPAVRKVLELIRGGAIGDVRLIRSNFTFNRPAKPDDARYQADQAGGSLMDVGCYCVNFIRAVAGREPTDVHAIGHIHQLGTDDYAAGTLRFGDDLLATFTCGMTVFSDLTTCVAGTDGYLVIHHPWFSNGRFEIVRGMPQDPNAPREVHTEGGPTDLYDIEARAFGQAVRGEAPPWITREDSLGNQRTLDAMRRQIGLPV